VTAPGHPAKKEGGANRSVDSSGMVPALAW